MQKVQGYQGYQGYNASPVLQALVARKGGQAQSQPPITQDSVDRYQGVADALTQSSLGYRHTPYVAQGVAQIGEALLARRARKKADKHSAAFAQQQQVQQQQAQAAQQAQQAALLQQGQSAGLSPRELIALQTNPGEYGKAAATGAETRVINDQLVAPGGGQALGDYRSPIALGQGESAVNPATGQTIASVAPKPTRSFEQELALQQAGANRTTVNTGDAPNSRPIVDKPDKGYQRIFDEESGTYRDIPIPGSRSALQRQAENTTAFRAIQSSDIQHETMTNNIREARELIGASTVGFAGLLKDLPASSQRQLRNRLDTVRSNIGFDKLQEMRENSPTGGALGQVSEREIDFLQATRGKLDQLTKPSDLLQALEEIEGSLGRLQEVRRIAYEAEHGQGAGQEIPQIRPSSRTALPDGYEFTEDDIAHTMAQHGLSREEVLAKLGGQ